MVLYARDILVKDFLMLPGETSAIEAARVMKEKRHGFVLVASGSRPEGIVTEWDYLARVTAEGNDPAHITLRDIMTREVVSVKENDSFEYIAKLMTEKGIRRVVVTRNEEIVGVITTRAVMAKLEEYVDKVSSLIARLQAPPF